ncbi:MAG: YebC/PmpR family DNA-binding transcriptional regulator [Candidatus Magasanikbacteria bacterium]|nr:YebC/PmpR family DNA-binding transcriptional regulator [Candidatus Magasanikbacteria bacterium]
MSGHSKWSKIKNKKGKEDQKRGAIFTKATRAINLAARQGGGNIDMNFSLRLAVEKAKSLNMPKDNIERAIKKGAGETGGVDLEEILYEGFGVGGIAIMIETLSDNRNRTGSEVKNTLTKNGGSLGAPGSVKWQFERKGVVRLVNEKKDITGDWESLQLALMDAGAEDIREADEGVEIISATEDFKNLLEFLKKSEIETDDSGLEWVAREPLSLSEEASIKLEKLVEKIEDCDDVQDVFTNQK